MTASGEHRYTWVPPYSADLAAPGRALHGQHRVVTALQAVRPTLSAESTYS